MRLIKYSVAVLLFLLVALCNGELFQLHFMEADYPDWVEVNLQDIPVQAFYTETDKAAKESGVSVFYRDYNYNAAGQSITLYASDDNAAQYYESTYGIAPGVYKSLFMGDAVFEQASLADCTKTGDSLRFGLLGKLRQRKRFSPSSKLFVRWKIKRWALPLPGILTARPSGCRRRFGWLPVCWARCSGFTKPFCSKKRAGFASPSANGRAACFASVCFWTALFLPGCFCLRSAGFRH